MQWGGRWGRREDKEFSAPRRKMESDQTVCASYFETYGNIIDSGRRVRINTLKRTKKQTALEWWCEPIKDKKKFQLNANFNLSLSDLVYI